MTKHEAKEYVEELELKKKVEEGRRGMLNRLRERDRRYAQSQVVEPTRREFEDGTILESRGQVFGMNFAGR